MATFHAQILNLHDLVVKLKKSVINYVSIRTTGVHDVERNIQSILSWVEDEKANANRKFEEAEIAKVGIFIKTCVDSLESLKSGNQVQIMKGCLSIASSMTVFVGGPYRVASLAICGILTSILLASSPKEPDLVTVFTDKVHVELLNFNQELKRQVFAGLQSRVKNMNAYLEELKSAPNHIELPDKVLYETDFPQFIGEVAQSFMKGLKINRTGEDRKNCLKSMVIYCNAQTALFLLLTNILAAFESTGRETRMVKILLDTQIQDAKEKLGFLSQEKYLKMSCMFKGRFFIETDSEDDLRKVETLCYVGQCRHLPNYGIIEGFREALGMPTIQKTIVGLSKGIDGVIVAPKDITKRYPQPHTKGDNHYFQLINHSHLPVSVRCGTVGSDVNGLKFSEDVRPYSSHEHVATKSMWWTFSTGGVFIMDLSEEVTFSENVPERNRKVFEFALSNPFIGFRKSAILQRNPHIDVCHTAGKDCWLRMNSANSPPIYFDHCNKHYVVFGGYTFPGWNECRTWRFVIQEYDPLEDLEAEPFFDRRIHNWLIQILHGKDLIKRFIQEFKHIVEKP